MSLSKKDIELLGNLIEKKVADAVDKQTTAPQQENKTRATGKIKPHSPEDKIKLIKKMNAETIKSTFGLDLGFNKENPYRVIGVTKFHENFNITSDSKWYKPRLTYEEKHLAITQLLKGKSTKTQTQVKNRCIKYLQEKIKNPPKQLYGKKPSEKQLNNITTALQREINRW